MQLDACIALKDFPVAPFIQRTIYVAANAKADENAKAIKPSMLINEIICCRKTESVLNLTIEVLEMHQKLFARQ